MKKLMIVLVAALAFYGACAGFARADEWTEDFDERFERGLYTYDYRAGEAEGAAVAGYVQDGLIAHYDAILNSGKDFPHNPEATIWTNLVANGPHLEFKGTVSSGNWTNGYAYSFNGASYAQMKDALVVEGENEGQEITVELVFDIDPISMNSGTPVILAPNTDTLGLYGAGVGKPWWNDRGISGRYSGWSGSTGKYLTALANTTTTYLFQGTNLESAVARTEFNSYTGKKWVIAGSPKGKLKGRWHAMRFYNRPLTAAELGQNRAVDEARFRRMPNVQVRTTGPEGVEKTGGYYVNGTHTFTVTDSSPRLGKTACSLLGYRLETWNALSRTWDFVEDSTEKSFTYTNCTARAHVRITWLWTVDGLLRTVDGEADDYVQLGLLANYDGKRNVGIDAAHDPEATTWKNLVAGGPDLSFVKSSGDTDCWTNNSAYAFSSTSYAEMKNTLTVNGSGLEITIEMVLDADPKMSGKFLDSTASQGYIYGSSTLTRPWWENRGISGAYIGCYNWTGKYLTAMSTEDKSYIFQGTNYANQASRSHSGSYSGYKWKIGKNDSTTTKNFFHAVRFYNRGLSRDELSWNREIDESRFRGVAFGKTNIVVASTHEEAQGNEPNGAYFVKGKWTFTANEKVTLETGKKVPLTGRKVEKLVNGQWTRLLSDDKAYYDYEDTTDGIIRLTWRFGSQGMRIIVR